MSVKINYKNRLPHIAPIGGTFFVTFRLGDSLPITMINELKSKMDLAIQILKEKRPIDLKFQILIQKKLYFKKFEHQLDALPYGKCYLEKAQIAKIMQDKLHEYDRNLYNLISYCIMPNHVHVLFDTSVQMTDENNLLINEIPEDYTQLHSIMKLIKGGSGYSANKCLGRTGSFWAKDSYDHFVRDEKELYNIIQYIICNPVKARLVKDWREYPYTFLQKDFEIN